MPSTANGIPYAAPNCPMSPGQRSPSSNERTVPDTAPTAKVTATMLDQWRAKSRASASPRRWPRASAISIIARNATPRQARTMWNPRVKAIWLRAASRSAGVAAARSGSVSAKTCAMSEVSLPDAGQRRIRG